MLLCTQQTVGDAHRSVIRSQGGAQACKAMELETLRIVTVHTWDFALWGNHNGAGCGKSLLSIISDGERHRVCAKGIEALGHLVLANNLSGRHIFPKERVQFPAGVMGVAGRPVNDNLQENPFASCRLTQKTAQPDSQTPGS